MITKFYIENFRSIQKQEVELGKITVLTGANNSGKTSVIYAMLVLKNFVDNPNQNLENILIPAQTNLGGFKEIVFKKLDNINIRLGYDLSRNLKSDKFLSGWYRTNYELTLGKTGCSVKFSSFEPYKFEFKNVIGLPYPLNKNENYTIDAKGVFVDVVWNGATINAMNPSLNIFAANAINFNNKIRQTIIRTVNGTYDYFQRVDYVPLKRGFSKPYFNTIPLTNQQYTEEEIATLLATSRDLAGKVSAYLERFSNKIFHVWNTPGIGNFYLQVRDRKTGFITDLVNEGLGLNQLVTILTKILKNDTGIICIDEPEIHLHPSYIDILAEIIVEIVSTEYKQFVLSTHSEHLVLALLNRVAERKLKPEELKMYYLTKDGLKTNFELQGVNEKGQIEGGLKSFYEDELKVSKDFFKVNP